MSIVSPDDLLDSKGYEQVLKSLESAAERFGTATEASVTRIKAAYDLAIKSATELRAETDNVNITQKNAGKQLSEYANRVQESTSSVLEHKKALDYLTDARKVNNQFVDQATKRLAELQAKYQSLDSTEKNYERQQKAILRETRTLTTAIDAQGKALKVATNSAEAAEGSYQHLSKQTAALRKELQAEVGAFNLATGAIDAHNKKAREMQAIIARNEQVLAAADRAMGRYSRNVGNYPQGQRIPSVSPAMAGVAGNIGRSALGVGAALTGIDSLISSIQKIGDVTLQFDSLDSALRVVSDDTALYTQRQAMLGRMSEDLGQDLSVLEQNYTNLTASSKGTRLEGAATDKIFESIVGTMARLKKPAEDVNRALLAVGQMMSKGTVQSEELRGQIGEVLPGAFNIAAKSMGVTTSKLSDMLKNGEVMASELLPKFAAELEKTFNPNNEQRVEGLAANLARMRNEGVEWVKSMNIGDKAGEFIGWLTRMGRSIREEFSSPVELSSRLLAEQTEKVNQLESALPALLTRYDELKSKSKLTTTEQVELRSVINDITALAPSAATGFDQYGNALDINKDKVIAFTAAQRQLNAELNKQTVSDLNKQIDGNLTVAGDLQKNLNRGTKQQSFNWKPFFLMTDEERKRATDKDAGKRREVPLTDADTRTLQQQLQTRNQQIQADMINLLNAGGKLSESQKQYVEQSGSDALKLYSTVSDNNDRIIQLRTRHAALLFKNDKDSIKEREAVFKELEALEGKRRAILNPTQPGSNLPAEGKTGSAAAANKARNEALSLSKANSDKELKQLADSRQDGLISEQDFIEKRLEITQNGLDGRMAILARAGKKETDDYKKLQSDKIEAETEYKRAQLKLDLDSAKNSTTNQLKELDNQRAEGVVSEVEYVEQRHRIAEAGFEAERRILEENGKLQTQLGQNLHSRQLDEQVDYHQDRLKAESKSWKEQLAAVKDGLAKINQEIGAGLDTDLNRIEQEYAQKLASVEIDMASGKLNPSDGAAKLHQLKMDQLADELQVTQTAYAKDADLSRALVDSKIEQLQNYRDFAMLTPAEIEKVNDDIRKLEKQRDQDAADDKIDLDNKVADNAIAKTNEELAAKKKAAEQLKQQQEQLADLMINIGTTTVNGLFAIEQQRTQNQLTELEKRRDYEIRLVGDNADAKAAIEKRFDEESKKLKQQQDKRNRAQALFNIAVNTAVAISKALAEAGPLGIPIAIAFGVLGAVQAGIVASTALPAYKDGKKASDPYTGKALAGEAGSELFVDRDGYAQLLTKPTIIDTKAGDTIFPAHVTSQLLNSPTPGILRELQMHQDAVSQNWEGQLVRQILIQQQAHRPLSKREMTEALGDALDKRPVNETIYDEEGVRKRERRGRNMTTYLNQRNRFN